MAGASDFLVQRAYEGAQVLLTWVPPDAVNYTELRILRTKAMWPASVDSAALVMTDTPPFSLTEFSDRQATPLEVAYYKLFQRRASDDAWETSDLLQGKVLVLETGYFAEKMWALLPQLYHTTDGEQ